MGIRLLQTYITKSVPDGLFSIDIQNEVDTYKRQNPGTEPLIVIDLLAVASLFYASGHEILLGGRYNIYRERAIDLFGRIKSFGVQLVFFFDGPTTVEKNATCLRRENEKYCMALNALHLIYSGVDLSTSLDGEQFLGRTSFFGSLKELAKRFGDVRISYRNDCDLELAEYATRSRALAIISQDSDFLIYEGDWRYWSARDLNIEDLSTTEFNRVALRRTLGLHSDQMAIFATMSGNDYFLFDSVRYFHKCIKQRNDQWHFTAIANQIRSNRLSVATMSEKDIRHMAIQMFIRSEQDAGVQLIRNSLKLYDYSKINTADIGAQSNFDGLKLENLIYSIVTNRSYTVSLDHFDLSKTDFISFPDLVMPIIRRMMGVLLKNDAAQSPARKFYFKLNPTTPYEEVILQPDFPLEDVPPIESLLSDPIEPGSSLHNTRSRLLSWLLSSDLDLTSKMMRLPVANISNVATLRYLVQLNQIQIDEADCLLLACNCSKELCDSLNLADMRQVNERDARLAFLYVTLWILINRCFQCVGLNELCSAITFDGLYFHTLRKQWSSISDKEKEALLQPYDDNLGAVSDEQGERFHQDIKRFEERFQGHWNAAMLRDYFWRLQREDNSKHKRKN